MSAAPTLPGNGAMNGAAEGKKRIVVYTAIFGGYDAPPAVTAPDPAIDYLLFTDDTSEPPPAPWRLCPMPRMFVDPQRDARRVKVLAHSFLPGHDLSVWIDGSCELLGFKAVDAEALIGDHDIAAPQHRSRRCVYDEADAVLNLRYDSPVRVRRQMEWYRSEGFPTAFGLHTTAFLLRRHLTAGCRAFLDRWWDQISNHSKRDQLSFDYVRWRLEARVNSLPIRYTDNPLFRWRGIHRLSQRMTSEHDEIALWPNPSAHDVPQAGLTGTPSP